MNADVTIGILELAERIKMAAPEIKVSPASVFRRFAAFFYDSLLLLAIYFLISGIAVAINGGEAVTGLTLQLALLATLLVSTYLFYWWFWCRSGQTLGMQAWRIKLISHQGKLSAKHCAIRLIVSLISVATAGLGFFWMIFDKQGRTWQDIASQTQVYRVK